MPTLSSSSSSMLVASSHTGEEPSVQPPSGHLTRQWWAHSPLSLSLSIKRDRSRGEIRRTMPNYTCIYWHATCVFVYIYVDSRLRFPIEGKVRCTRRAAPAVGGCRGECVHVSVRPSRCAAHTRAPSAFGSAAQNGDRRVVWEVGSVDLSSPMLPCRARRDWIDPPLANSPRRARA